MISSTVQVLMTTAWRATKKSHLLPCEIGQFQAIEEDEYERRTHFYNCFLWTGQDRTVFLN
jgi:hypothetical protein